MSKSEVRINAIFVKNRVAELGLKQWWLAEQIGVDRRTVVRWLQGQVKLVQLENAEQLAKVLKCPVSDLVLLNEADQLATPEDQKLAASYLVSSSVIEKLGPIGEWNVVESLLKATIVPGLPLNILGELYDQLTIASWRQSKIDQAAQYNLKTLEIAHKSGDKALLAAALLSQANIHSWRGEIAASLETYMQCLELQNFTERRVLGSVCSNYGSVLYESGNFTKSIELIKKALAIFHDSGRATNLSIGHCHLARLYLQTGDIEQAAQEAHQSIHFANLDDYRRGKQMGKLVQAELAARRKLGLEAQSLVEDALEQFEQLGIVEGLNFEFAGRVFRMIDQLDLAESYVHRGLAVSKTFPIETASLNTELAEIWRLKKLANWSEPANLAIQIYEAAQCPLRVLLLKNHFQIK